MLTIHNLTLKTRHDVLNNFSYSFEKGHLYGIVAPNGSGKTTFFRAINHLIPIHSGTIRIDGRPVTTHRQKLFYFEDHSWFDDNLSGWDYLQFIKYTWKSPVALQQLCTELALTEYVTLPIKKYSLGMKQKLMLAMYVASDAEYLIMDELSNGLDEANREQLFTLINRLTASDKMVMVSSHYKDDLTAQCDYLLELKNQRFEVHTL